MPNSYNGWPASENKASINVVQHPVYAGGIKAGDVTTVLQYVSDQLNARVEKIVMGHCWGYAYRANVNNPSSLSCHASGTAIDFNAPAHPNGASNTFSSSQVSTIKTILKEVENSVKWLQGYDEMHFEIGVNASTLAGVASRLKGGSSKPPASSTPPPATGDWFDMATKEELRAVVKEELAWMMHRTLNVMMDGKGNAAYPAGSSIALDNMGIWGRMDRGVHASRTGQPNSAFPNPGTPKD